MHVELLGDLLDCLDTLEGFQCHSGFELRVVSFAFGFHFVGSCLGVIPSRNHQHRIPEGIITSVSKHGCMPKHVDLMIDELLVVIAFAVSDSQLKKRDPVKREAKQDLRSLSTQPDVSVHQPVKRLSAFRQFRQITFLE
jgi:hypothetical protein